MDESKEDGFVATVRERVEEARGTIEHTVGDAGENAINALNEAVTIIDESVDSTSTFVNEMSQGAFDVLSTVVDVVEDYITENNLDIQVSDHHIRIEGDAEGLRKIETDLKKALKGRDVHVEYDREDGIDIEFGESIK